MQINKIGDQHFLSELGFSVTRLSGLLSISANGESVFFRYIDGCYVVWNICDGSTELMVNRISAEMGFYEEMVEGVS